MVRLRTDTAILLLQWMREARDANGSLPSNMEDLFTNLADQIDHPNHIQDMLDKVARLLTSTTVINGRVLTQLRAAILSPSELAKVEAADKITGGCYQCGSEIREGEIASQYDGRMVCVRCMTPVIASCKSCNQMLDLPGIGRILSKVYKSCHCATTQAAPPMIDEPQVIEERPAVRQARVTFQEALRQAEQEVAARRRVRPVPAEAPPPPAPATTATATTLGRLLVADANTMTWREMPPTVGTNNEEQ